MTILGGAVGWKEEGRRRDDGVGADDGGAVGDGDGWEEEGHRDDVGAATSALPPPSPPLTRGGRLAAATGGCFTWPVGFLWPKPCISRLPGPSRLFLADIMAPLLLSDFFALLFLYLNHI